MGSTSRRRKAVAPPGSFEARLRQWAEITELCLALRGSTIIGPRRARSWRACVKAGLAEANRERERRSRG